MNPLDFVAPATMARRREKQAAARFAAKVRPGVTYYSITDCTFPWGNGRLLMEWRFGKRSWITGEPMSGHLSASGVWLGYGPIHESRPPGLQTFAEYRRRPEFPPNVESMDLEPVSAVPAGV